MISKCKRLIGIMLLIGNVVFSQNVKEHNYSKIKFNYEQKSNYLITKEGVYADTLLFAFNHPNLKFSKVISPIDSTRTVGFVKSKNLFGKEERMVHSAIYHTTHKIEGTYDLKII